MDHCTNNLVKTHSLFHFPFLNEWSWNTDKNSVYNVCIRGINGKSILSNGHDGFLTLKIYDLTTNLLYDEKPNIFNNYTYWSAIDFIPLMSRFIQEGLRVEVWNGKEKVTEKNILREHPYRFFSNKSYISFDDDKLILEYPSDRHLLNRVYGEITDSLLHSYRWAHQNQGFTNVLPMSGDVIVDFSGGVGISSIWYNYYNPSKGFLYEKDNDMREILYNNVKLFDDRYEVVEDLDFLFGLDRINYLACSNSKVLDDDIHLDKFNSLMRKTETLYVKSEFSTDNFNLPFDCWWLSHSNSIFIMGGCR